MIHKGEIPDGVWVLHRCNNPECSNPEHLYAGTPKQNTRDAQKSGNMSTRKPKSYTNLIWFCVPNASQLKQIIEARLFSDKVQLQISHLFQIDISHYSRFENGKRGLPIEKVLAIARFLGIENFNSQDFKKIYQAYSKIFQ